MENYIIISDKRQVLKPLLPLQKPLSLFIEPTNRCNFRCSMCVHGSENTRNDLKPFGDMSLELYEKIIHELKEWEGPRLKKLRLTMLGEPLLHKNLPDMIELAVNENVSESIDFFSNGAFLTPELSEKLVDSGLSQIRFSIYSVLDDKHRDITRQERFSPTDIQNNIRTLKEIRDKKGKSNPVIFVKMFDTFGEENNKFTEMYGDIADMISLEKVHDATKYSGNDLVRAFYKDESEVKRVHDDYEKSLNNHIACPRPFMALCIDTFGNVLMCTHDPARLTKIANVNNTSLQDIWRGSALYEFRKMLLEDRRHENKLCKNCTWFKLFPPEDNVDGIPIEKFRY